MSPDEQKLFDAADKITVALNEADLQGFHVIVDEDGDGGVTVWSEDREDFAEAARCRTGPGWETKSA
jgi:type IV secretory pathway VirD2 relaxase